MKDSLNIVENSNSTISIKNPDKKSVVSITAKSKELISKEIENACVFKVSENGKILIDYEYETVEQRGLKSIGTSFKSGRLLDMFENLPEDLSDLDKNEILSFLSRIGFEGGFSRILPYKVKLVENGDIEITLVIYNGDQILMSLSKVPLKLVDASKSTIIADLVDINALVNSGKIGIFKILVGKEMLKKESINLEGWSISFGI